MDYIGMSELYQEGTLSGTDSIVAYPLYNSHDRLQLACTMLSILRLFLAHHHFLE